MSRFLAGGDLARAIIDLLAQKNVRCAVAFLGTGAKTLFDRATGDCPRLVCDVTLGGTSPRALRELGAPTNGQLRHIPNLHAKVYISDEGAVVASANASRNGIGIDGSPTLIEAGTWVASDEPAFAQIASWFEAQWKLSGQVDTGALDLAAERFRPGRMSTHRILRRNSLLGLISADPDRFSDISFVFVKNGTTQRARNAVRSAAKEENLHEAALIDDLPDSGMFTGWGAKDLSRWRRTFVELWMPGRRLSVYGRQVAYFDQMNCGVISSRANWQSILQVVEGELPSAAEIAATDGPMVRRVLDKNGNKLFNAHELAAEIECLSSES